MFKNGKLDYVFEILINPNEVEQVQNHEHTYILPTKLQFDNFQVTWDGPFKNFMESFTTTGSDTDQEDINQQNTANYERVQYMNSNQEDDMQCVALLPEERTISAIPERNCFERLFCRLCCCN